MGLSATDRIGLGASHRPGVREKVGERVGKRVDERVGK